MDECNICGATPDQCCCPCCQCGEPAWACMCADGPLTPDRLAEAFAALLALGLPPAVALERLGLRPLSREEPE